MIKFRVLIIEKNDEIKQFLKEKSITIVSCKDFESYFCDAKKQSVDTIIINICDYNTTDAFKYISQNADKSILVVNANSNLKYQLYECGAYDVMIAPIDKIELKYKILVAIKKSKYRPQKYILGDLIYEIETGTLKKGDKSIILPTLQNKIFALLLNGYYENRIIRKDEVFNSMIDESSRIQNHIARLRYSLSNVTSEQVIIETVYGKGYKLLVIDK